MLPGLGDAICASHILRRLRDEGATVDVLTMFGPVSQYAKALGFVADVYQLPLLTNPLRSLPALLKLRRAKYEEVYVPFPATRWQYAFVARLIAKNWLIMHDYRGFSRGIAQAGRARLVALRGGHRAYENLRLLRNVPASAVPSYEVPAQWLAKRQDIIGVHFGTMVYKKNEARRWPLAKFVELVRKQLEFGRRVRLFIGPSERSDSEAFSHFKGVDGFEIIDASLEDAARRVCECAVFVANDAGFAHLAAALGVQTITLFGMTDPVRAQPLGRSVALRPSSCPPCHDEGLRTFACARELGFRCTGDDFPVDIVLTAIETAFERGLPESQPRASSDFRLYGRLQ
jgi:ADP-heptose:LPS heptosyltransferase